MTNDLRADAGWRRTRRCPSHQSRPRCRSDRSLTPQTDRSAPKRTPTIRLRRSEHRSPGAPLAARTRVGGPGRAVPSVSAPQATPVRGGRRFGRPDGKRTAANVREFPRREFQRDPDHAGDGLAGLEASPEQPPAHRCLHHGSDVVTPGFGALGDLDDPDASRSSDAEIDGDGLLRSRVDFRPLCGRPFWDGAMWAAGFTRRWKGIG